jgi:[ribosomal protein S18]-alanine N-acetyltransferase
LCNKFSYFTSFWRFRLGGEDGLQYVVAVTRAKEVKRICLEVRLTNAIAQRLYRSAGFTPIGRRTNYYQAEGGYEDAIVLALEL